jgi:hypothetical protein
MGPDFNLRFLKDKRQLSDAVMLPQRIKPLGPPPNQQQPNMQAQAGPMTYQMPAGAPNPGAQFGAPPPGPPGQPQQPMATRLGGFQAGAQAPVGPGMGGININLSPAGGFQGAGANMSMPMGKGQFDVGAALDNAMKLQDMQARYRQGPFSAGVNYEPGQGAGADLSYERGPLSVSGGVDKRRGARGEVSFRKSFGEGGLASPIRTNPADRERDVEFINTRNQHMREVVGRPAYAKGGGAWTRKEGQNPEGGLNAKGRASLRAQGQDIKPPVSAKQAKKSPKAAARRSSFCARMSGMPGPMKDEKGRPTRKALSLRKWDC